MPDRKDDIKTRLLATFRVEAEEHLQAITANLLALEVEPSRAEDRDVIEATFREVHTLKGAARSVSLMDVEALCQACESVLSRVTRGQLPLSRPLLRRLQETVDGVARLLAPGGAPVVVRELIDRLEHATSGSADQREKADPVPAARADAARDAPVPGLPPAGAIRLAADELEALLVQAEDLLVLRLAAAERTKEARALMEALARRQAPPLESELRAAEILGRELLAHLTGDERVIGGTVGALQDGMRRLRMTPASSVLDVFPRMVRDLAEAQGRHVEWVTADTDLEVDRKVLQMIKVPLIHLVRNAVDHGIESPEARAEAGKPPRGRVAVTIAAIEGNRVEIRVEDDGRGIDPAQVRAAAARARLLSPEQAQDLTDEQALDLIYRSGLSTSPMITDVSGHGLGLAIVKERIEQLAGDIRVSTRLGAGTTVRMVVPATVATFRGLLVHVAQRAVLVPTEAIDQVIRVRRDQIKNVEGRETVRWNESALAVASLGALLEIPEIESSPDPDGRWPCVVMRSGEERMGLFVDEILGDREVLVKELKPPLVRVRNVACAGLLGTGQLVLVLRPGDLLQSVRRGLRRAAPQEIPGSSRQRQPTILVVDDSITTRTMEKNLLEAAGYGVRVAVDGVEGWTLLKSEEFDLVVSDVDMPRMNGFELTARIRSDGRLAELPVVLVTALESREDKERGIEVGANAYVVKSSFDQSNLLEIIRRLL
jgi:two-component system chemotaxis sensor kinase CheA